MASNSQHDHLRILLEWYAQESHILSTDNFNYNYLEDSKHKHSI